MKVQQTYVVDNDGWDDAEIVEACRLVLGAVRDSATEYETDIPIDDVDWPPEVAAAAEVLRGVAKRTEKGGYAQTGIRRAGDEHWSAFVTFAPWAYDATVWGDAGELVSLADEGRSIAVWLDAAQLEALGREVGGGRLVPKKVWRQRRRRGRSGGGGLADVGG